MLPKRLKIVRSMTLTTWSYFKALTRNGNRKLAIDQNGNYNPFLPNFGTTVYAHVRKRDDARKEKTLTHKGTVSVQLAEDEHKED
jgi:hypothetical protein